MEHVIFKWWSELLKERKCYNTNKTVKTVGKYPLRVQENVCVLISNCIKETISDTLKSNDINKKLDLCNALNGCFDNFPQAADGVSLAFSEIISFIDVSIDECGDRLLMEDCVQFNLVKMLDFVHYLSRILVLVLKLRRPLKCEEKDFYLPEITSHDKELLSNLSFKISHFFKVKEILMDTKCTLAMASLLIREILLKEKEKLAQYHRKFLATLPKNIKEEEYELNVFKFLLGNAMLNTWSSSVVDVTSTEIYLTFFIQLCESYSSDTGIILNISRTLLLLIKNDCFNKFMKNLGSKNFHLINSLLSCVYMLLDHPVPCVRHSSKDFLRLLAVHEKFKLSMLKSLPTLLIYKRSYFICLAALADETVSQSLFDADQSLQDNLFLALHDPALVTYVIDALQRIIVKDYSAEKDFYKWCERWIVSLLGFLRKVPLTATSEIEKLLQGLLTQYPSAILFIIYKWYKPKNDEELRYIMAALKVYNKHSLKYQKDSCFQLNVKSSSGLQEKKWKDIISEKLLRFCLHHNDDDLRVSAFALIVEGLKSTEKYTEQDFSLIQYSLRCNLNNQQPATRQKFLSLIKKMLTRYADSLAVLKRNDTSRSRLVDVPADLRNYARFEEWLFDFCFSNIFDGANFNRLNTILSLLLNFIGIMNDVTVDSSAADDYWRKILVPLRSSYEENKIMAVILSKNLNIFKVYNDTKTVKLMFKKAYDLCGKIEPPNVLTGAYLMQALLEYPLVCEVVEECFPENKYGACSGELLLILMFSKKLEEQISRAEVNLIKAAMTGPMYGILFAIRIILQQTNFLKVDERKECGSDLKHSWSGVLKNLIGLSFRMINVVSCVVNSSSPEGHLPSDFQSDLDFMMNQHDLPQAVDDKNDKKRVEETAEEVVSGIQSISLDDSRPTRTREEIINDCQRFIRRFNNVFLSHGESRLFSLQNVVLFKSLLTACMQLMSELEKVEADKTTGLKLNDEYKLLTCLSSMENELKNCIATYEKHSCKRDNPTAQVLLLCSWRSIKEACLFLGDLVSKLPLNEMIESGLLTEDIVVTIGIELRALLCEIKHRGAFEHAYVGFSHLITAFWKCPRKNLNELPQKWLQEILAEIKQPVENQKMKFCSSRRSAGLPFLVQAIISSELQCTNSAKIHSLDITMNNLLAVVEAKEDSVSIDSKIHSLNILRALFKHAMFGEYVAPYVSRGVMVAVRGSRAAAWGIRNSSSLLFSALIIRIFGVARNKDVLSKKNRMTGRHFFQRYPELYEFFLNEMKLAFQDNEQDHTYSPQPHVFLILLILGRLYPSLNEGIDFSEFLPFINTSCRNPTLKIRELGARALVPLICSDTFIEELEMRFSLLKSNDGDSNYRHGMLLQVKIILLEMWEKTKLVQESIGERGKIWIQETESILDIGEKPVPYLIKISYIQILHTLFKMNLSLGKKINEVLNKKELLDYVTNAKKIEKNIPGCFAYLETLHFVKFDIAAYMWSESGNSDDLIASIISMLNSEVDEVQAVALVFLQFITTERYEDLVEEEEANLITVNIKDLFCIQNENRFKAIKLEVLSRSAVLQYVIQSFVSLLINAKDSTYLYKMITKLKITVISNFLLQNLISVRDIYDSWDTQGISCSIMDLLSDIVDCRSSAISVGAFICYGVFFFENLKNNDRNLTANTISYFTKLLCSYSDIDADVKQRKAACEIFNKYYHCFTHDLFKKDNPAMSIWMLPVRLLSDEDPLVRGRAMRLVSKYQNYCKKNNRKKKLKREFDDVFLSQLTGIPYKAQETLLECYICLLDENDLIHLVVQMVAFILSAYINTINYEHSSKQNEDGVFEKGNPNPFCEDLTFGKLLCSKLEELKISVDVKSLFRKKLDPTHIASLKEFFPSLILPHFPETLIEFCIQIVKILKEDPEKDIKSMSCSPIYVADLVKVFDV